MNFKTFIKLYLKNQLLTYIDVGAADNISRRWSKIKRNLNFIGFEPNSKEYKKIYNNDFGKFNIYNFALGNVNNIKKINILNSEFASSFLLPNYKNLEQFSNYQRFQIKDTLNIRVKKLDSLKLKKADFIKIDTQGYNLEVLKGSSKTLDKLVGIEIETEFFRIYKNQKLFEDTKKFLEKKNFEFINFYNLRRWSSFKDYNYGRVIFCNSLFLKKLNLKDFKNKKLVTKYIVICVLYNNIDLAHNIVLKSSFSETDKLKITNFLKKLNKRNYFTKIFVSIFNRLSRILKKETELYPTF
tara:strand:+ start:86 stop:979 length:894 start_codon:yes stop_codon:yes gene_type:complete